MLTRVSLVVVALAAMGASTSIQTEPGPVVASETLVIAYQPEENLSAPLMIDELDPEVVLTIRATGFEGDTTGTIKQCVSDSLRCQNRLRVRFDDSGAATFQYLITDQIGATTKASEACRLGDAICTIELRVADKVAVIETLFVDMAPPLGRIEVTPRNGLLVGDTVTVVASNFSPQAELTLTLCASPSTSGSRCGAPGPVVSFTTGVDGTAETVLTLDTLEVGSAGITCGRRVACKLVTSSDERGVRARPVNLSFAEFPGADYDPTRLGLGIAAAVLLLVLAAWLVRSTDWRPPRESDSSLIDAAEYADLDAEAAQFEAAQTPPLSP